MHASSISSSPDPHSTRPPARPYQRKGTAFLKEKGRAANLDEPGLGKSRQAIDAAEGKTLVIAPGMVLDGGTWVDEIAKWAPDPELFSTAPYSWINARKQTERWDEEQQRVIRGNVPVKVLREELRNRRFDTVILDEAHYVKGRDTSWTWASAQICKGASQVFLLTGTPIPNWAHELWSLLRLLFPDEAKPGKALGSYWKWVGRWFEIGELRTKNGKLLTSNHIGELKACDPSCLERPRWDPCDHYRRFMDENLRGRMIRRLRDDVLGELPPLTESTVECPMKPDQKRAYARMKKDYLAQLGDGSVLVAWSSGAQNVALDRITTGVAVLEPPEAVARMSLTDLIKGSGKLARLVVDLKARSRPTLVFSHYRASVEAAHRVASSLGMQSALVHGGTSKRDRELRVRAYQRGDLDVLVGSLETLAEGLQLTAADMLIFLEKSFKPSRNEQALRRIHRLGQTRPVTVLDYVTPDTVDEKKRALLDVKTDRQVRYLSAGDFAKLL